MTLVSPERLSNALGSIYKAAYVSTTWDAAIGNLGDLFHGSKTCICKVGANGMAEDAVTTNPDPAFIRSFFEEHAHQPNVLSEAVNTLPIGTVYSDHALVGADTLRRSRFWNEWMAPQDMYGSISCKLPVRGPSLWFFDVQRGRSQAPFDANDAELVKIIAPHLARVLYISQRFQSAELLASTFSHLPFGVIVIDGHMRITTLNASAEAILLRAGSALVRKSGHLVATDAGSMAVLQKLVAQACSIRDDVIPGVGGDLLLRIKRGDGADLALSVGPLVNALQEIPFSGRHAVIFIRQISLDLPPGFAEQIRAFFDLTPKEAGLAASLASGMSLKEAAEDAHIQFSTARSYLEKIFQKTGTRQQSQLVALLKSAPMIARKTDG
jgi:DNA-binding CsgD family transcriptional regulator